jgi:hypothetical protein
VSATSVVGVGTSSAAAWIIARTGVSATPIVSITPVRAPSQWVTLIMSAPLTPGK